MNLSRSANESGTTVFGRKKTTMALICLIGMLVIGDLDYVTGYETSVVVAYLLPVGLATIEVGPVFAIGLAVLSMAISIGTDLWLGIPAAQLPIQIVNAAIALTVFVISVCLLQALKRTLLRRE